MNEEKRENNIKNSGLDDFGSRLRYARKRKQLNQTELARMLGYKHNGPISTMENGKTSPDLPVLQGLAECLNVDLHWLVMGKKFSIQGNSEYVYNRMMTVFQQEITKHVAGIFPVLRTMILSLAYEDPADGDGI